MYIKLISKENFVKKIRTIHPTLD